jgi:4-hydroxy-4-methyl-2-oxoglutarate aldolase
MIENPPLLTIRRKFPRPAAGQLAAFAGVPTGHLVDSMNGRGALSHRIKPISATKAFHGVALTCDPGPGDCLALFGTLDVIQPGDVVLVKTDGFSGTAVLGDLLLGMMKNNGAAGFVTDGLVRDTPGIRGVGLPCYAAGVTPNSPAKTGPGTVGLPIVVGGVTVDSGDIVVGDEDGVVIIPRTRIAETLEHLKKVQALEAALEAKVKAGLKKSDIVDSILRPGTIREVD